MTESEVRPKRSRTSSLYELKFESNDIVRDFDQATWPPYVVRKPSITRAH
ncbi:hypothetical protein M7I_6425 [Glarea lozoyensis 74030]|uniref:Uncharacterized protein n=1 Tax=Glarea lozoyensis (strain ATCC 74030 / MF5533) TaxID=1104152 RepID=H0EUJ0_GLAL7|nr:hypothetical protein M7I_6425 [Glarea lozoyensis 74030]